MTHGQKNIKLGLQRIKLSKHRVKVSAIDHTKNN